MVYEVESRTEPGHWYRCDLTANGGGGHCSCQDHKCVAQPALDRGEEILRQGTLCEHTKAAYWHFLRNLMPELAHHENTPPQ